MKINSNGKYYFEELTSIERSKKDIKKCEITLYRNDTDESSFNILINKYFNNDYKIENVTFNFEDISFTCDAVIIKQIYNNCIHLISYGKYKLNKEK